MRCAGCGCAGARADRSAVRARLLPSLSLAALAAVIALIAPEPAAAGGSRPADGGGRPAPRHHQARGHTRRLSLTAGQRGEVTLDPRATLRLARLALSGVPPDARVRVLRARHRDLRLELSTSAATPAGRYVLHLSAPRRGPSGRPDGRRFRTRVLVSVRPARDATPAARTPPPAAASSVGVAGTGGGGRAGADGGPPAGSPAVAVPNHVPTWAYDDSASAQWCNGGAGASPQLVRAWLTYAESNCGPNATKALSDCHADGNTYCTA